MNTGSSIPNDFDVHLACLQKLSQQMAMPLRSLFTARLPTYVARAPGRLDVMGGIADYSGGTVLELPIAEAAFAAVQVYDAPSVTIASVRRAGSASIAVKQILVDEWLTLRTHDYAFAHDYFANDPHLAWASYIAGPVLVLLRETQSQFAGGFRILIDSSVPEGKGVSSSAAIEVATMRAVAAALGISLSGETLARLCQKAENLIAGAPCGLMDQVTAAVGRAGQLLALRCQPATVEEFLQVPERIAFWGIDSGVRHSVGGADYASVRCGAFMGYRIIAELARLSTQAAGEPGSPDAVEITDPIWHGYLANISPSDYQTRFADAVPLLMKGRDFLDRYIGTSDRVARIDPDRTYAVSAPTRHPIEENQRVNQFRTILREPIDERSLLAMGALMRAAHDSYTHCGLGSSATDLLVQLIEELGPAAGLYGAKITGGGSGGTVAVLGRADADDAIDAVARRYSEMTCRETYVFRGSSPGAYSTPVQQVVI